MSLLSYIAHLALSFCLRAFGVCVWVNCVLFAALISIYGVAHAHQSFVGDAWWHTQTHAHIHIFLIWLALYVCLAVCKLLCISDDDHIVSSLLAILSTYSHIQMSLCVNIYTQLYIQKLFRRYFMTLAISFTHKKQFKFAVSWKWMGGSVEVLNGSQECLTANYIYAYICT